MPELRAEFEKTAAEQEGVGPGGKEVTELRPPIPVNKGTAAVDWAGSVRALGRGATAIYIGDDRTDEDAFQALRAAAPDGAVTIRVADPESAESTFADFALTAPDQVREFLEALLAMRRPASVG